MDRRELDIMADQLENVLKDHRVEVRVTGGSVLPRRIQFLVQPAPGVKINKIEALSREIAIALKVDTARVTISDGAVRIDVPRNDPSPVRLMRMLPRLPRVPLGSAVLGLADDGAPLLIRLPSPDVAHILVAGTTGSGKTALVQTVILSLALLHHRRQMQFVLIDPKGRSFEPLAALPHLLRPIVSAVDEAASVLREMVAMMERRDVERVSEPQIVIVIDELADLAASGGDDILTSVERLVQRGREAGIHVIGATQKPSSTVIGSIVKSNFPVRLIGRVTSPEDARVAAGVGGTDAEKLLGRGDFIAVTGTGNIRFQAAYATREEMAASTESLKRGMPGADIIKTLGREAHKAKAHDARSVLEAAIRNLPRTGYAAD